MARNRYDIDEELESPFDIGHLRRSGTYLKKYYKPMLLSVFLSSIATISLLMTPQFMLKVIDIYIPKKNVTQVFVQTALIIASIAIFIILTTIRYRIMAKVGQSIVLDIRRDMFEHLQKLSFNYFDSRPHGKILVRVVQYANNVSNMLSNGLIDFILELFNIVFITIFMFFTNAKLSLFVIAGLPIFLIVMAIITPWQRKAWQDVSNKGSNINAYTQENINGVKITQIFVRETFNQSIFSKLARLNKKAWMSAMYSSNISWLTSEILSVLISALIMAYSVLYAKPMISIGVITVMVNYCNRFWQPITNLSKLYNELINTVSYLERIFELMDETVEIENVEGAKLLPKITGQVTFENVTFSYEEGRPILENLNFDINPGERIALVGPTGAGKTTIVNLLSRFYDLDSGKILVDGHDISQVTLHSLRSQMGIMLQDSFIFSGTIGDNILYGNLDATMEQMKKACETVRASEFIDNLPDGYNTEIKEGGSNLSQGQKQLISFARTLIADPKILILDEATSSIDTKTEKILQESIEKLLQNRTSFIIAHRLSTIMRCDKIMYVDDKNILECGNHDELIKKQGLYYKLYTSQLVE